MATVTLSPFVRHCGSENKVSREKIIEVCIYYNRDEFNLILEENIIDVLKKNGYEERMMCWDMKNNLYQMFFEKVKEKN